MIPCRLFSNHGSAYSDEDRHAYSLAYALEKTGTGIRRFFCTPGTIFVLL